MAWALACWCLKNHHPASHGRDSPSFLPKSASMQHSLTVPELILRWHFPPYLKNGSSATWSCLSYAPEISFPQSPSWTRPGAALFTSELWNHTSTTQQAKWSHIPWDCLLSEIKGPLPGNPLHRGLREFRLSEKRLDTARHMTVWDELLIWRALSLLPPPEGWLHIIFYLHIYGFLLEMICVSLSLFSRGIKKRNSNCWTQWSESSH